MKRLALLALLLASSPAVSAPAPLSKPQRKAERPAAVQTPAAVALNTGDEIAGVNAALLWAKLPERLRRLAQPAQPPNADPPG